MGHVHARAKVSGGCFKKVGILFLIWLGAGLVVGKTAVEVLS